jgi:isoleucyl-tRNA synthetase
MKDDEILTPVMGDGATSPTLPLFGGLSIWKANPKIVEQHQPRSARCSRTSITHSYMHCWRHKTPIICARPRSGSPAWTDVPPTA